jgi:SET domain-containing protein
MPVIFHKQTKYASQFDYQMGISGMTAKVVAKKSGLHGMGLFAARNLAVGERLIEYTGIRYGKNEYPDMGDDATTKFLGLSDGTGIDGTGWAALANHSCDPNCELVEEEGYDPPRAWLYTLRKIRKNEELVWDYRLDVTSRTEAFSDWACFCHSPQCRGTMANPEKFRPSSRKAGSSKP